MKTQKFDGERIDVTCKRSFEETVSAFEAKVPGADPSTFVRLVTSRANAAQIEQAIQSMAGDLGLMRLAKLDPGPLVSLLGRPKKLSVYLVGNPSIANRMYEHHPASGLYAPLRVEIYEDYEARAHFTYDRPSSLLGQFDNDEIRSVGQMLDEKMSIIAAHLG